MIYADAREAIGFLRMLTYADVCWRMLTYAIYADAREAIGFLCTKSIAPSSMSSCPHMSAYVSIHPHMSEAARAWHKQPGTNSHMSAYVSIRQRMLTYADTDVCWRMLTQPGTNSLARQHTSAYVRLFVPAASDICGCMLTYADICWRMPEPGANKHLSVLYL